MLLLAFSPKLLFLLVPSHAAITDVFIAGPVWGESRGSEPFEHFEPDLGEIDERVSPANLDR